MSVIALNLKELSRDVPWKHAGRHPSDGLDCVGLVIWALGTAGVDISRLDLPYRKEDLASPELFALVIDQLRNHAEDVTREWHFGREQDGDVMLWSPVKGHSVNLSIYAESMIYEMTTRLRVIAVRKIRPMMLRAFRFKELNG